jgi:hypothetical protein
MPSCDRSLLLLCNACGSCLEGTWFEYGIWTTQQKIRFFHHTLECHQVTFETELRRKNGGPTIHIILPLSSVYRDYFVSECYTITVKNVSGLSNQVLYSKKSPRTAYKVLPLHSRPAAWSWSECDGLLTLSCGLPWTCLWFLKWSAQMTLTVSLARMVL